MQNNIKYLFPFTPHMSNMVQTAYMSANPEGSTSSKEH